MPTQTNLPPMVHLYLELIEKLSSLSSEYDSLSDESMKLKLESQHYMGLIREEMLAIKEIK